MLGTLEACSQTRWACKHCGSFVCGERSSVGQSTLVSPGAQGPVLWLPRCSYSVCCSQVHLWGYTEHVWSFEVHSGLTDLCCLGSVLLILTVPTVMLCWIWASKPCSLNFFHTLLPVGRKTGSGQDCEGYTLSSLY